MEKTQDTPTGQSETASRTVSVPALSVTYSSSLKSSFVNELGNEISIEVMANEGSKVISISGGSADIRFMVTDKESRALSMLLNACPVLR